MSGFQFELLDEDEVPPKPKEMSKNARASLDYINQLQPGKVGKITPPDAASMRGIKLSLARVGSANGKKVEVWSDETHVYVKLAE